jgi:hypothetical protein
MLAVASDTIRLVDAYLGIHNLQLSRRVARLRFGRADERYERGAE